MLDSSQIRCVYIYIGMYIMFEQKYATIINIYERNMILAMLNTFVYKNK